MAGHFISPFMPRMHQDTNQPFFFLVLNREFGLTVSGNIEYFVSVEALISFGFWGRF